eukprot:scaffold398604_cov31-Prasinocladus_malaysianus.AAC.1
MASGASFFGWVTRVSCEEARKAMPRPCCSISGRKTYYDNGKRVMIIAEVFVTFAAELRSLGMRLGRATLRGCLTGALELEAQIMAEAACERLALRLW